MYTHNNSDWLALLLCGLLAVDGRSTLPATNGPALSDRLLKRYAPVFNSIARLLVFRAQHEVVALAFTPSVPRLQGPTFILAQNSDDPQKVKEHLVLLISHLRETRELYISNQDEPSSPDPKRNPLEFKKLEGEITALHYCWMKIKRRFTKDGRYEAFLNLVADVQGDAADLRTQCNHEERRTLKALQCCPAADLEVLQDVRVGIEGIRDILLHHELAGTTQELIAADVKMLVPLRVKSHFVARRTADAPRLWSLCDNYLRARHKSHQLEHDVTKRTVPKPFDVAKWLDKIVRVSRDYLQILSVVTSSTMASVLFGDRPLEVVLVPTPRAPEAPTISTSDIRSTLSEVGWTDIEDAQYHTLVEDLRRSLNILNTTNSVAFSSDSADPSDALISETPRPSIHPECALLAHLHEAEDAEHVIPYIALSKRPCWLCATYFECYRQVTNSLICTRGTDGRLAQSPQWRTPSLSDFSHGDASVHATTEVDTDAAVRKKLCDKLTEKVNLQAQIV
ncbi:hypothetical protein K466DRAFT_656663 [Polyporus arcularius HHB13444]|uniref:Uncharacterized protein n=1 Tax=Polyporus arcularius HHB13444 TaxID=1314778 RepID=A0A5C3NTT2_9APHY|nr:hypothetical protein K466DRAFT_656663 [Polyporus arcularius HHB13444]